MTKSYTVIVERSDGMTDQYQNVTNIDSGPAGFSLTQDDELHIYTAQGVTYMNVVENPTPSEEE